MLVSSMAFGDILYLGWQRAKKGGDLCKIFNFILLLTSDCPGRLVPSILVREL